MADEVHFATALFVPEVHVEHVHAMINEIDINLFSAVDIGNDQTNTRRRGNGTAILISKPTHSRALGLLVHAELISPTILDHRTDVGAQVHRYRLLWFLVTRRRGT